MDKGSPKTILSKINTKIEDSHLSSLG